jgi:hypothetical protein
MVRRRTKAKTKRSRKPAFNLMNAAQTYANTAIITRAAFRTNPIEFFTGYQTLTGTKRTYNPVSGQQTSTQITKSGYQPIANGQALTLPELLGFDSSNGAVPFGGYPTGGNTPMENIKSNIALNGGLMVPVVQTIGVNVGFAVARKLLSKQRRGINKVFKMAGLRKEVMV